MYQMILVPLDGTELAERALPYARALADASHARLLLVRAVRAPSLVAAGEGGDRDTAMANAEGYLASLITEPSGSPDVITAAYFDDAAETIIEESRLRKSDLIVMSTHARAGLERTVYGSVAERVFREVNVPVLFIPAGCDRPWLGGGKARVLVPLDGSAFSEEALGPARDLAAALHADLILLRVVPPPEYVRIEGYPDLPEGQLVEVGNAGEAESYLETVAARLRADGCAVETRVAAGDPVSVITLVVDEEEVSAVAMATHGRGGLARLIMGSVATGVLQQASAPLLLARPAAIHQQEMEGLT